MSNTIAIATVTAALRNLLATRLKTASNSTLYTDLPPAEFGLSVVEVTTQSPDKARSDKTTNQLNLFLYQVTPNAALQYGDRSYQHGSNEIKPPLALDLHYLLTAYGHNDNDVAAHVLLGEAMRLLHDHAVLSTKELQNAMLGTTLDQQIERVRLTLQPFNVEDVSKLWTAFQAPVRVSAAYQVGVVLIDSHRSGTTPLPVLQRGSDDRGVSTAVGSAAVLREVVPLSSDKVDTAIGSAPVLREAVPSFRQPAARLGEWLLLKGDNFTPAMTKARLRHMISDFTPEPLPVTPQLIPPTSLLLQLPDDVVSTTTWPAGVYTVELLQELVQKPLTKRNPPDPPVVVVWSSNAIPFVLAPRIEISGSRTRRQGDISLMLRCRPPVHDGQQVRLLFDNREVAPMISTPAGRLTFDLTDVKADGANPRTYVLRLRVDGAESMPFDPTVAPLAFDPTVAPLAFDPEQILTVVP